MICDDDGNNHARFAGIFKGENLGLFLFGGLSDMCDGGGVILVFMANNEDQNDDEYDVKNWRRHKPFYIFFAVLLALYVGFFAWLGNDPAKYAWLCDVTDGQFCRSPLDTKSVE